MHAIRSALGMVVVLGCARSPAAQRAQPRTAPSQDNRPATPPVEAEPQQHSTPAFTPPPSELEQRPAPGSEHAVAEQMTRMKTLADGVIAAAQAASGPVPMRHQAAALEVIAVMRPLFGPANAWLFQERERKLAELATALGLTPQQAAAVDVATLDALVGDVEHALVALKDAGFDVRAGATNSALLDWMPATAGRRLEVGDPKRTIRWQPPYAEPAPDAEVPELHPHITMHFFPMTTLRSTANMVARRQPGVLVGALPHALVITQPLPGGNDQDDGTLGAAVAALLLDPLGPAHGLQQSDSSAPHAHARVEHKVDGMEGTTTVTPLQQ